MSDESVSLASCSDKTDTAWLFVVMSGELRRGTELVDFVQLSPPFPGQ